MASSRLNYAGGDRVPILVGREQNYSMDGRTVRAGSGNAVLCSQVESGANTK